MTLLFRIDRLRMALIAAHLNALSFHSGGGSVALGIVSLFPHLLGSPSLPLVQYLCGDNSASNQLNLPTNQINPPKVTPSVFVCSSVVIQHPEDSKEEDDDPHFKRLCTGMSLCICHAANCGGIATLTGTGPNLIMKAFADE